MSLIIKHNGLSLHLRGKKLKELRAMVSIVAYFSPQGLPPLTKGSLVPCSMPQGLPSYLSTTLEKLIQEPGHGTIYKPQDTIFQHLSHLIPFEPPGSAVPFLTTSHPHELLPAIFSCKETTHNLF